MKFDKPGIIGFRAGGARTDSFVRLTKIINLGESGYNVHFMKPNGRYDFWFISSRICDSFIEIDGIRYVGDMLDTFCEAFMAMAETEKVIDSL